MGAKSANSFQPILIAKSIDKQANEDVLEDATENGEVVSKSQQLVNELGEYLAEASQGHGHVYRDLAASPNRIPAIEHQCGQHDEYVREWQDD